MTILILNTKTATAIAKTFKTATVNTEKVLAAVTVAYREVHKNKNDDSLKALLMFWDACEKSGDKKVIAKMRTTFNRASNAVHKAAGIADAPAKTVKKGKLVDVVPRNSKKAAVDVLAANLKSTGPAPALKRVVPTSIMTALDDKSACKAHLKNLEAMLKTVQGAERIKTLKFFQNLLTA